MAYCPSSIRFTSRRSPLHFRTSIIRSHSVPPSHVRSLWWWSRSSQSTFEEDVETERFLRSQRMLRHRYAKIARRRAMWDREPTPNLSPWHAYRKSLKEQTQKLEPGESSAASKDQNVEQPKQEPAISFHKDFDSFRRAMDRALERDPYGTLFGRRLWSPQSTNNMSWTSFSWFADPKDIKETTTSSAHTSQGAQASGSSSSTTSSTKTAAYSAAASPSSVVSESISYVYDPISGRKVPEQVSKPSPVHAQKKSTTASPKPAAEKAEDSPRRSIFDTLFGENTVEIPVKTYETKVYGYTGKSQAKDSSEAVQTVKSKSGFENSRKREFQKLKAAMLGNTIDTTAEFGGKYTDPNEPPPIKPSREPEAPEDAPLFSGTTYEGKAATILSDTGKTSWLQKEGFGEGAAAMSDVTSKANSSREGEKIQSALDRLSPSATDANDQLQPSLDRSAKSKRSRPREFKSTAAWKAKVDAAEKAEDIDLLRSSDVRSGMKLGRQTKQGIEDQKKQVREDLEKSFKVKEQEVNEVKKPAIVSGLDRLRKHMASNPGGIVARTFQSLEMDQRLKKIQKAIEQVAVPGKDNDRVPEAEVVPKTTSTSTEKNQPHPLSQATVKEGVPRHPAIENHTHNFEPQYIKLLAQMKEVRRELHESRLDFRQLKSSFRRRPWNELESERLDEYAKSPLVEEDVSASGFDEPLYMAKKKPMSNIAAVNAKFDAQADIIARKDHGPRSFDEPVTSCQPKPEAKSQSLPREPTRVEPPVFTPAESPVWNDEQPPPVAELRSAVVKDFTSPYVMLINNGKNGVRAVPAPNLPHLAGRKQVNPFEILAGLQQDKAAQFLAYFPRLQETGYELVNGDANKLTFRKVATAPASTVVPESTRPSQKAATVLDEIPAEIDPPGPSAPIAPPSSFNRQFDRKPKPQARIRRQEEVFSGTTTAPTGFGKPLDKAPTTPPAISDSSYNYETQTPEPGIFAKAARTIRRVTLTIIALAGGAYIVGVISEGVGAQTQAQQGLSGEVGGPRKRIVLPMEDGGNWKRGTRPGIYSTESSR